VRVALATLLALAGCGFQPLYGERPTGPAEENLARISIGVIADRTGQILRNELGTRLDPNNLGLDPLHSLRVSLSESISNVALRRDTSATRANLTLTASYSLWPNGANEPLYSGTVRSVKSYDILSTENEFGTLTARDEARRRAARDIADQIALRLALALDHAARTNRPTR
jgi:LPS-assembly lipoprotein